MRFSNYFGQYCQKFPFFCRFGWQKLGQLILDKKINLVKWKKNDILPISLDDSDPKCKVFILLNGRVIQREHTVQEPNQEKILAVRLPGSIIGVKDLDLGTSCQPIVWSVIATKYACMCELDKETFDMLWAESTSQQKQIEIDSMMQFDLFKLISVQTQHKIVHESGVFATFQPGECIMPWHIRSPWNEKGYRIYKHNKPVINTLDEANSGQLGLQQ